MNASFKGQRSILNRTITIDASPDTVFPLLCPVRESEWADGWVGKAIYSSTGLAEENGVFASEHAGEQDTIWFVTRRDTVNHQIEFVYFVPAVQVVRLLISLAPAAENKTNLTVNYIRTGISDEGNEFIAHSRAHFDTMMAEWETSMNYYVKTGKLLKEKH